MDTVTEAAMAIAMARAGGLGIIHRFMTVEQQVRQIKQVKRSQGFVVDNPYAIGPDESISDATRAMQLHEVGGLVVTGKDGRLVGLVTHRDILLAPPDRSLVREVMTPADRVISVGPASRMRPPRLCSTSIGWRSCRCWMSAARSWG